MSDACARWLDSVEQMKKALQDLERNISLESWEYGAEVLLDEEDLFSSCDRGHLFDEIEQKDNYSTGDLSDEEGVEQNGSLFDKTWFEQKCEIHCLDGNNHLSKTELYDNVLSTLKSSKTNDELQQALTDILGYSDLELVQDLILHRQEIINSLNPDAGTVEKIEYRDQPRILSKKEREEALRLQDIAHKSKKLGANLSRPTHDYPHIYRTHEAGNTLDMFGRAYSLPIGSKRDEHEKYEEIAIPATKASLSKFAGTRVSIADTDKLCQNTFKNYTSLNMMQSLVYPVAYRSNENMLICAPTGAGKTDAAMLTILNTIAKHCEPSPPSDLAVGDFKCHMEDFKIIYVAPMKALAAEIVEKFGRMLKWLGVEVRECTGDMQLTKAEILRTQIIVTTPEKWDVITRKSTGDVQLVQKVRLLIIDEVHMLHDERGAVIESIVARTQRQVESTQSMIRIIGLSATLPNYVDVASFLMVNPRIGLFYFDASFRPVPLEQHFIGVKGKPNTRASNDNLDKTAFEKVKQMLEVGHQVMVFVHSRKDTVKTARTLYQLAMEQDCTEIFDISGHPKYDYAAKEMGRSKGRELRDLFPKGFSTHHAGMARSDRNLVERLFADGVIKVLCCTATLAWGVNLPAAAVVIKGTQVYSAEKGSFVDLSILDVLQIFGRAGRPQFQQVGIGFICTTHDKLAHYLSAVTQQHPIESKFSESITDNLNAEISLGTVTTVSEAVQWLGYTYMYVRWRLNPLAYGIDRHEIQDDPALVQRRRNLIIRTARHLQKLQMVIFHEPTESLAPKNLGRTASTYYIQSASIERFNRELKSHASEADIFKIMSSSREFENITPRESENQELTRLRDGACACEISGQIDSPHVKTNILLQSHISRANLEDFALVSDCSYVAQNSTRICGALFKIALNRRWGHLCHVLLTLCKSIEKRIWPYQHPLSQFDLPQNIIEKLEQKESTTSIQSLKEMQAGEIGFLVNNTKMGVLIKKLLDNFPTIKVDVDIAPLNRDVLRMHLSITPEFRWNDKYHGTSESYYVWVENSETSEIYHYERFILFRKNLYDDHELHFTIPMSDPLPSQIYVRAISERWLGAETVHPVSFQHLIRPDTESVYTELLNLQPLPITALKDPTLEAIYSSKFQYFNPMQTQVFHTLYHTSENVLLGSPTGSGKTVACELAMWWAFRERPGSKVVYIAPMKALVKERLKDWGTRITELVNKKIVELTGDNTPDIRSIENADIIITTPEKWDGISRSWQNRSYVKKVSLVIMDEIHLLGGDRGPVLEIIVSRMNYISSQTEQLIRLMGMSTACANATDLANWLGVKRGLFNFRHSVRPVPLEIYIDGFPEQAGFCPLMQSMNRPAFLAIKTHSPDKPVLIFVPSRRQTRLTATDIIALCGLDDNPRRFLHVDEFELDAILARATDPSVKQSLSFGIGLHHAGLVESDRQLAEELFLANKIQLLITTATLAWGVNLPAHLVIVKGTQIYDPKIAGYKDMDLTDVLQMLGRAGRPQFDSSGIAKIFTQDMKKEFYKYFLHTGFPVESCLHKVTDNHFGAEISARTITTKQDALDYLTWTFFFRRLHKNPSYYGLEINPEDQDSISSMAAVNDYLVDLVESSMNELQRSGCVILHPNGNIDPTPLGKIASWYYLSHKTVRNLVVRANPNATVEDCLVWLSTATEYDELPVRHNEDLINAELSKNLPFKAEKLDFPMWDPHVKVFLLLQAYMSHIELPISDYVTDLNSVLDQCIRIMQASIDVLAELGYFSSCLMMMTLMQCIKQARWPEDGPLSILPGVHVLEERRRADKGITPQKLMEFLNMAEPEKLDIAKQIGVDDRTLPNFLHVSSSLPIVTTNITSITATTVGLTVQRLGDLPPRISSSGEIYIYAPRFPKSQTEGFFIVLAQTGPNGAETIHALKRMVWPNLPHHRTGRGVFTTPRTRPPRGRSVAGSSAATPRRAYDGNAERPSTGSREQGISKDLIINLPPGLRVGLELKVIVVSDGYPLSWTEKFKISEDTVEVPNVGEKNEKAVDFP